MAIICYQGFLSNIRASATVSLDPGVLQDGDRGFLILSSTDSSTSATEADRWMVAGRVRDRNTLEFIRRDTNTTGEVGYILVTCTQGEFRVTNAEIIITTVKTERGVTLDHTFELKRCMVIGSNTAEFATTSVSNQAYVRYTVQNQKLVEKDKFNQVIARRDTSGTVEVRSWVQVVEWDPATGVQCFTGSDTVTGDISGGTSVDHGVIEVDASRTWLIANGQSHTSNGLTQVSVTATLPNNTQITYARNSTGSYTSTISWWLCVFPENSGVTTSYNQYTAGSSDTTDAFSVGYQSHKWPGGNQGLITFIDATAGTGTGYARNRWRYDTQTSSGDLIVEVNVKRFRTSQVTIFETCQVLFHNWHFSKRDLIVPIF